MMRVITLIPLTAICASLSVSAMAGPRFGKPIAVPLANQVQPTEDTAALRIGAAPIMPRRAKRSGYCCMLIDVNTLGEPENIRTAYCTDSYFKRPSIKASKKWKFSPAIKDGIPVKVLNQKFTNKFILQNTRGKFVQDKEKILVTGTGFNRNYADLCNSKLIS